MTRLKYNDQYHSYWIDGERATGVSTVAKGFQDSYNIDRKIKRDVAKGMARRPDLCSVVVALGDVDDWETKKKIDKVATEAIEASGAWAKANHGTAKHTILERVHKGISLDDVFDDRLVAYAAAYRSLIEAAGLIPVSGLTERFVVYPDLLIAGRMDCAYIYEDGAYLLGDFKSGANAVAYPHSIVAQLGLYLNAPYLYNEETDEFDPAPEWGDQIIVAHVPDDITQFGLWTIDADLARQVALAALERHRYIKSEASTLVTQWIVPSAALVGATPVAPTAQPADPFDGLVDGHVAEPAALERREWVIGRLKTLATYDGALEHVGRLWPSGLATFKQSDRHTDADLDRIIAVVEHVEAEYTASFEEKEPSTKPDLNDQLTTSSERRTFSTASEKTSATTTSTPPSDGSTGPEQSSTTSSPDSSPTRSEPPDEGPAVRPEAVEALQKRYEALSDTARAWINGIARDAQKAQRPMHLAGTPGQRRHELVHGLVTLAANNYDDDEILRGLLGYLMRSDEPLFPTVPVGAVISTLDAADAVVFGDLCNQFVVQTLVATVRGDGHLVFSR